MVGINISVSPGEFYDRLTILEIKHAYFTNPKRSKRIAKELSIYRDLSDTFQNEFRANSHKEFHLLFEKLKEINKIIFDAENRIRIKEKEKIFDDEFTALSRSIYKNNDLRSSLKTRINELYNSGLNDDKEFS